MDTAVTISAPHRRKGGRRHRLARVRRTIVLLGLLSALVLAGCGSSDPGSGTPTATGRTPRPIDLDFRPVLFVYGPEMGSDLTAGSDPAPVPGVEPGAPVPAPEPGATAPGVDLVLEADGVSYALGPALASGDLVESAEAELSPTGQWVVNPVFKPGAAGIDQFNEAAALCSRQSEHCPTGQLAIVLDGELITAPSVNQDEFQRDQIQISGNFTEAEARSIAARITGDTELPGDGRLDRDDRDRERDDSTAAGNTPPTANDHWHAAYGIYVCDAFLPPLEDRMDQSGIHTHADGLIHIHPFSERSAGVNANWATFGEAVELSVEPEAFALDGVEYDADFTCDGQPAQVVLYEWRADDPAASPIVHTQGIDRVWFHSDRLAYTLAVVPDGADVPRPRSIPTLDDLSDVPR